MLKVYIQDHGKFGCCVVITDSLEKAKELMKVQCPHIFVNDEEIKVEEVKDGFVFYNYGDL